MCRVNDTQLCIAICIFLMLGLSPWTTSRTISYSISNCFRYYYVMVSTSMEASLACHPALSSHTTGLGGNLVWPMPYPHRPHSKHLLPCVKRMKLNANQVWYPFGSCTNKLRSFKQAERCCSQKKKKKRETHHWQILEGSDHANNGTRMWCMYNNFTLKSTYEECTMTCITSSLT